jgi:hypothetical protein
MENPKSQIRNQNEIQKGKSKAAQPNPGSVISVVSIPPRVGVFGVFSG